MKVLLPKDQKDGGECPKDTASESQCLHREYDTEKKPTKSFFVK